MSSYSVFSGKLGKEEFEKAQANCETAISKLGHIKILIIVKDFAGWEKTEGWEDTSFLERNDPYIKKMAIVGEEKWRDMAYLFTLKGLRPLPIEYFSEDQEDAARQWLLSD
jgi:hypothetical protein